MVPNWSRPARKASLALVLTLLGACQSEREKAGPSSHAVGSSDSLSFEDMTDSSGVRFIHETGARGTYSMRESIGSGGALLDFDNDGDLDIYLVNGEASADSGKARIRNRLYRQDGPWKFTDVTEASGAWGTGYGMGAAVGDVDNDGYADLYVSNHGRDVLYRNRGDGTFDDATARSGLGDSIWSTASVFLDYDRDGDLDLYVGHYGREIALQPCSDPAGRLDYCGPESLLPLPATLYRNRGNGVFEDVSGPSGIASRPGKTLGAVSLDFDGNGFPDIYAANDGEPNHLWLNRGDGTFREQALAFGMAVNGLGKAEAGMGIALGDADGDGHPDLYITHLRTQFNKFYRSAGGKGFIDDTQASAAAEGSQPFTGWGTVFLDYDNDGDLDLAAVNGRVVRWDRLAAAGSTGGNGYWDDYAEPGLLYENLGPGRFRNVSRLSRAFGGRVENSRGLLAGDLDNDGGMDLVVTNAGGRARLFRNAVARRGNWIELLPVTGKSNRPAYGAVLEARGGGRRWMAQCQPAQGFLASQDPRVHIGLGGLPALEEILVHWPDGRREAFRGLALGRAHILEEGQGSP